MSGTMIIIIGSAAIVAALVLFVVSIVYRSTTGKRIRQELEREYQGR